MKKKHIFKTFAIGLAIFGMTALASCTTSNPYANDPRYPIYELALADGFIGTYQQWLETIKGEDGENGQTPHIGENGNWWIGDTDTGVPATGPEGPAGSDGQPGSQGEPGKDGADGQDGKDGTTPHIGDNGNWWIGDQDTGIPATGADGQDGQDGTDGKDGVDGQDGINGTDGVDGKDGTSMLTGSGVPSNDLGNIGDSYVDTDTWDIYIKTENGWIKTGNIKGQDGEDGINGADGVDGKDGTSVLTGNGAPNTDLGKDGDSYIDLDTWDFYVKVDGSWILKGNIKGQDVEREYHTVSFDTGCDYVIKPVLVEHGEKIIKPSNPIRKGYNFTGWTYLDEPWVFHGYVCTEDMVLKANWEVGTYTVRFVNYDRTILLQLDNVPYGTEVYYTGDTPHKPSDEDYEYTFIGWDKELIITGNTTFVAQYEAKELEKPFSETVTIDFWYTYSDYYASILQDLVYDFEYIEPNIQINLVRKVGGYDDLQNTITQGFTVGDYPDICVAYPQHVVEYLSYDKVVRLDEDYIAHPKYGWAEEDLNDFYPSLLEEGASYTVPGTYSLPFAKSTEAMFYNADVLIGLDLSGVDATINGGNPLNHEYLNNLTWEELFGKLCPAIVTHNASLPADEQYLDEDNAKGIVGYDSDDNLFITLAEQYGYDYTAIDESTGTGEVLFNNDGMKSLMKTFNKAYQDGYLITKNTIGTYVNYYFTEGELLFSIGSTSGTKYQYTPNFETDIARIPAASDGNRSVFIQGQSLAILDHEDEERALASWLFTKFLLNEENSARWAIQGNFIPNRASFYQTDAYKEFVVAKDSFYGSEALGAELFDYYMSIYDDLYYIDYFKGCTDIRSIAGKLLTMCLMSTNIDDEIDTLFLQAAKEAEIYL